MQPDHRHTPTLRDTHDMTSLSHLAFNETLREAIAARLDSHDRLTLPLEGRRHAAVAILLLDSEPGEDASDPYQFSDEEMHVIPGYTGGLDGRMAGVAGGASFVLCRRSAGLNTHASQWALPGGRLDDGESIIEAALRETWEEVGVQLDESHVLGVLDDYATRSGYVMTPVVVWGGPDVVIDPNPDEVLAAYRIGLHELAREDSPRFVEIPESDRPVVQVPLGGDLIHAPTGAVIVNFRWVCLDGRPSKDARVSEFEQPVFAWG
jgi:8-oxo-dGTP pyrophosphatase MutT (NUDIX family)